MDDSNVSLLIELLRQADEKLSRVEQRLEKHDTFMLESASDRSEIRGLLKAVQVKVDHLSVIIDIPKKKKLVLSAGAILGFCIGAKAVNWKKVMDALFGNME